MAKDIVVIGGGIIGLSTAYYLMKDGHQVTVLDKSKMDGGASYVNAGYIAPSHIIPLSSPGMMAKGIKWMFNSSSPFYMKPRLDADFIKWAWSFNKSSTKSHVEHAIPLIRDINVLSKELYMDLLDSGELGDFQLEKKGLLMVYKDPKAGEKEMEVAKRARELDLEVHDLDRKQLDALQPGMSPDVSGAVHYMCDAHTTPTEIMEKLKSYLMAKGVAIKTEEGVLDFVSNKGHIESVTTDKATYKADEFVLATGSWSQKMSKKLGLNISVQPGKGYRINVERPTPVTLPAILMEVKCAVTPMQGFTRFAGTMEFSGSNNYIRKERVEAIAKAAASYYNGFTITQEEKAAAQCGLRPVSPDGLPFIGRTSKYDNLSIGTGHAMMGWSLGPATGKLIAETIGGQKPSMPMEGFSPERRF